MWLNARRNNKSIIFKRGASKERISNIIIIITLVCIISRHVYICKINEIYDSAELEFFFFGFIPSPFPIKSCK